MVSQNESKHTAYSSFVCLLEIRYSLGLSKIENLVHQSPWLALMKQTPLLWEQFGDRSILLFWAPISRSEETMTVLWRGVNSSTWCCFPLSPGIQHQQHTSCPQEVLTCPLPPFLPTVQSAPKSSTPSLISNFSNPRRFTSDIKIAKETFAVAGRCCQTASEWDLPTVAQCPFPEEVDCSCAAAEVWQGLIC